jgi:peptide/nickel transport system ATP-binding protein
MGVIAEISDRVAVMYAGRLVEVGDVRDVVKNPQHPYSQGLMGSIPSLHHRSEELTQIEGTMPRLTEIPAGCSFHPRCPHAFDRCRNQRPDLLDTKPTKTACWLYSEESGSRGL